MSELKHKSDFNKHAADLLITNNLYAPSVHSSYYRCIQLMLYIIFHKKQLKTRSDFSIEAKNRRDGSHGHAIYLIELELAKKSRDSFKSFQALVPKLKEYREKSDYLDDQIKQQDGIDARAKADSIVNILNKSF